MAIPRVRITQRPGHGPPGLTLRGRTKPEFVSGPNREIWIHKRIAPANVFAEAIALLLGQELDVPIPDGAISQPMRGWLSLHRQSQHWDAIYRGSITNIEGLVCAKQPRDLPLDELAEAAQEAARLAERLGHRIPFLVDKAASAARCGPAHSDIARDFLAQRCLHSVQLTEQYLTDLEAHGS